MAEFHSQTATAFSSGRCSRLITHADAAGDDEVQAGPEMGGVARRVIVSRRPCLFRAVTRHHRHLDSLHGQQLYLRPKNVGHPPKRVEKREEGRPERTDSVEVKYAPMYNRQS